MLLKAIAQACEIGEGLSVLALGIPHCWSDLEGGTELQWGIWKNHVWP